MSDIELVRGGGGVVDEAPPSPPGLGPRGAAFWESVVSSGGGAAPSDSDGAVLLEACRTLDVLDALNATVTREGYTTAGSTGQTVVHPAVVEARMQRQQLARLLRVLDLDADDADEDRRPFSIASEHARHAANTRWRRLS